jgi:Fur family ferric uptake transcriptional regulator
VSVPPPSDESQPLEEFRRYLRERGLPVTTQREQVAEAVLESRGHLSVEDIEQRLRERGLHIGKATVYRTLDILARSGMITERDFGEGFRRYERVPGHPHHEHLICIRCGKVIEFTNDRLERLKALVAEEYGFQHHHHRLDIYGVCRECQLKDGVAPSSPSSSQSD